MADVAVLGAVGYAGAIAAQLLYRHPCFELKHVTARAEAGQRLDDIHPRTRVPLELEVFDAASTPSTRRSSPTRTARRRRSSPSCGPRGQAGRRSLGRLPAARPRRSMRTGTASTRRRSSSGRASTGCRADREEVAGADLVANPGCYPTAALLGLAPLARAGVIGDVIIDAKSGVSGAGRAPTHSRTSSPPTRTSRPTRSTGHRHTPEIEQELGVLGADLPITFMPHLLPLAQGELVSCYVTPVARRWTRTSWSSCSTRPTRASRSSSCAPARSA